MKKIAFVIPRFGRNIFDGAEIHARLLANHNKDRYDISILTTQSSDHTTWKNDIRSRLENSDGIRILRFPVDQPRKIRYFNNLTRALLQDGFSSRRTELDWIKNYGPYSSRLFEYLADNLDEYDVFVFFGYSHSLTYFGLPIVDRKAILIPLTHQEPTLQFKIYDKVFSSPTVIAPSTSAEMQFIKERFKNLPTVSLLGVGVDPIKNNIVGQERTKHNKPYILFIGRFEKTKGVFELCNFFDRYKNDFKNNLELVFIGKSYDLPPKNKYFHYLGVVTDQRKEQLITDSEFIVNPSYYESLSLTMLEAWQQNKAVLANGQSEVLKSQILVSNGGLFYENYDEFAAMVNWMLENEKGRNILGNQGRLYMQENYSWNVINKKLVALVDAF